MKKDTLAVYRCPKTQSELTLSDNAKINDDVVVEGTLLADDGTAYSIEGGLPDFTWPKGLSDIDAHEKEVYEELAAEYDKYASIPFRTFKSDEKEIREYMVQKLNIKPNSKVLEIGCGDGRGAFHIADKLGEDGEFYLQELSPAFLKNAIKRLQVFENKLNINYSIGSAMHLSYPDNYFNAAHHFGGLSTFSDTKQCFQELCRVVKPGGKILVGDESMGLWLRDTEFGQVMMNSNPLFKFNIPYDEIPVEARNVKVEWIMMGAFFLLEFEVGEGEPEADYFVPIPSARGGNHWIRYYGNLEGVTDQTKKMAHEAIKKNGKSMHEWLEEIVSNAAKKELND